MEIKIFGKSLFQFKSSKGQGYIELASIQRKESKFLPDFHAEENGGNSGFANMISEYAIIESSVGGAVAVPIKDKAPAKKPPKELTPKEVYELKTLNDLTYKLNTDPVYVEAQITDFKEKLGLIKSEEFDMRRGVNQIASIVVRLENRKKYPKFHKFFETFPYTTSSKVTELLKKQHYLKLGHVAQFVADMPREATQTMKEYNKYCKELCDKQAVFYIIANKKDFQKTDKRRDPILLAQSPFAHVWQILGAWDKEMMFLEEL